VGNQRTKVQRRWADTLGLLMLAILSPIILPLLIVALTLHLLAGLFLYPAIWLCWCLRGRFVLFVYSNSPVWQEYVEENILPRLGDRAVVLNWSQRSRWKRTLAVLAFRYFGSYREYNPMAVVFRPFRFARRFQFYKPFREFKHGKADAVSKMERELFESLDAITA
jgi:hypothetical protein